MFSKPRSGLLLILLMINSSKAYEIKADFHLYGARFFPYYLLENEQNLLTWTSLTLEAIGIADRLDFALSADGVVDFLDLGDARGADHNSARLLFAHASYHLGEDNLSIRAGRQVIYGGAAALAGSRLVVDGINVNGLLPLGFRGRFFVGTLADFHDLVSGAHFTYAAKDLPLSFGIRGLASVNNWDEFAWTHGLVGAHLSARLWRLFTISVQASFDMLILSLAEMSARLETSGWTQWRIGLEIGRRMPASFIPKDSIFAFFSRSTNEEIRFRTAYRTQWGGQLDAAVALFLSDMDDPSFELNLRGIYSAKFGLVALAEIGYSTARSFGFVGPQRLIQQFQVGSTSARLSASLPVFETLLITLWGHLFVFEKEVYQEKLASDLGASAELEIDRDLMLGIHYQLATHPLEDFEWRLFVHLRYRFAFKVAGGAR